MLASNWYKKRNVAFKDFYQMITFAPTIAKVIYFNQSESAAKVKNLDEFNVSANREETFKIQWRTNQESLPINMQVNSSGKSTIGIKVPHFENCSIWTTFENEFIPQETTAVLRNGYLCFDQTLAHEESVFVIDLQLDDKIYHIEINYQYLLPVLLSKSRNKNLPEDALSITPIFSLMENDDLSSKSFMEPSWDDDQLSTYSKDLFYREEFSLSLISPGLFPTL